MQSPPPPEQAPAAPAATPAPKAPTPTVVLSDGTPLQGLPTTPQEVQGLRERREMLRDQLERATNRRANLVEQLSEGGADEVRAGIQQRLTLIDERILQIERDQAATERLLSSAAPEVLALTAGQPNQGPMIDEDDAIGMSFGAFGLGIVVAMFLGRIRRRFSRRRAGTTAARPAVSALADDPHFERLTLAVDAIAEEVERIGEGQRFVTQLLAAKRETPELSPQVERR